MNENRNLLAAVILSMLILLGYQYFIALPHQAAVNQAQQAAATATNGATNEGQSATQATPPINQAKADLANLPPVGDVLINNGRVAGRINLRGARFDRLSLKDYQQHAGHNSDPVQLFNDAATADGFVMKLGWQAAKGQGEVKLPDATTAWQADRPTLTPEQPVTLRWNNGQGLLFEQRISLDEHFMFSVEQSVSNQGGQTVNLLPLAEVNRRQHAGKTASFEHEGLVGMFDDGLSHLGYRKLEVGESRSFQQGAWAGLTDTYWLVAVAPSPYADSRVQLTREEDSKEVEVGGGPAVEIAYVKPMQHYRLDSIGAAIAVKPGATEVQRYKILAGAKETHLLEKYSDQLTIPRLEQAVDFGWFFFIAKPLYHVLQLMHLLTHNYGLAIIALTLLVRIALFPLANASFKAMKRMKDLQPEMVRLKELYSDDKMRMNQELMKMYKTEGVNPLGGCLPILLQIPIFLALYKVLSVAIELRHAPFVGWIHDLSAPDPTSIFNLFGLIPIDLPGFLMIGVWPLLMGLTMVMQQRLNPPPTDPTQAMVFKIMPYIFTLMMAQFAAGLILYWTSNNLLSILQQRWLNSRMDAVQAAQAASKSKQKQKQARRAKKFNGSGE
jgi:YidC/Oxa1 family membrane protein insertase